MELIMTIESVSGTNQIYYLIAFDANGREFRNDPDGLMSQRVLNALTNVGNKPVTDVFLMSHGWMSDVPAARKQYSRWVKAMAQCTEDLKRIQQVRPAYQPLLIGLHWPSLPWGDEEFGGSAVAFDPTSVISVEQLINQYAERLASTPEARSALTTIFTAAMDDIAPSTLPPKVPEAYAVLGQETGFGRAGVA